MRLLLFLLSIFFFSQSAAEERDVEYKVKAGYLYNFTKFITWPENKSKTFDLCIFGKDPFGPIIDPIEKRTVKNKPIRLYRIQKLQEAKHCHLIYFSSLASGQISWPGILTVNSASPALTVGESKQFAETGGMIAFFKRENKVKLYINLKSLRNSGLEVSAKLLEVAEVYEGGVQ